MGEDVEMHAGEDGPVVIKAGTTVMRPQAKESPGPPETQEARQDLPLKSSEGTWF